MDDFQKAVKTCFRKYADFSGRAARPEFWWFMLFQIIVSALLGLTLIGIFQVGLLERRGAVVEWAPALSVDPNRISEDDLRVCDDVTGKIFEDLEPRAYSSRELLRAFGEYLDKNGGLDKKELAAGNVSRASARDLRDTDIDL